MPRRTWPGERPTGRVQTYASKNRGGKPPPKAPRTTVSQGCAVLIVGALGIGAIIVGAATELVRSLI